MVEPITTANVGQSYFATAQDIDPGILMMVVSMMHMDAAHESAKTKIGKLDDTFATLTKVAPLAGKVSQARDDVVESELQSSAGELAFTNEFQARYVDNATISEADNQRFQQQKDWAAQRGIQLENSTKIMQEEIEVEVEVQVETTDPDTGEVTTTTEIQTQTETIECEVADMDAIARNEAKIEAYQDELKAATADNAVLRQLIADHPKIQAIEAQLGELGHSIDLTTLSSLGAGIRELNGWKAELVAGVREFLVSAKAVHDHLVKLSDNWNPEMREAAQMHAKQHERELGQTAMELAAMKLISNKSESLPEFIAELSRAIQETEQFITEVETTN